MQKDKYSGYARNEEYDAVAHKMHIIASVLDGQFCKQANVREACRSIKGSSALD